MKFKLLKNEHGAVITHVALALSGIEREDVAQLIVSPQMALILKDKMSVKEIMTAISSMVMVVGNLAHRLVEMCEPQCETCDYRQIWSYKVRRLEARKYRQRQDHHRKRRQPE